MAEKVTELSKPLAALVQALEEIADQGVRGRAFVRASQPALLQLLVENDFLPEEARRPSEEKYARHLLHTDPEDRFCVAAMVWRPGQGTPIHDHDGSWGLIGMLEGSLEVVNYFSDQEKVRPGRASLRREEPHTPEAGAEQNVCGCADIHSVNNIFGETAVSVHIYARELEKCHVFEPFENGKEAYEVKVVSLAYTDADS